MNASQMQSAYINYCAGSIRTQTAKDYARRLTLLDQTFPELLPQGVSGNAFTITDPEIIQSMYQQLFDSKFKQRNAKDGNCATRAALGKYEKFLKANIQANAQLIFSVNINKSLLTDGMTIPVASVDALTDAINVHLNHGENAEIGVLIRGKKYSAKFTYVNNQKGPGKDRDVHQIRYSAGSEIAKALNKIFSYSSQAVAEARQNATENHPISISEESIDVLALGPGLLEFRCHTKESEKSMKDEIAQISRFIAAEGFSYPDKMIENFYLSLKTKPFVILAGISGTGKTRLVRLFVQAIGAGPESGRYLQVAVRPDWSDASDLFGHVDLNGKFVPGAIIDFILAAATDREYPYFLCLDEMNLARVEYYFSDFLSIVETRDIHGGGIESDPLLPDSFFGQDDTALASYGNLTLPSNLYVVGTVNMDETTFPFSKKVLDRANTIEFSYVDLTPHWGVQQKAAEPLTWDNTKLQANYLRLAQCSEYADLVDRTCTKLAELNQALVPANMHVGYRVRDEICFYLINATEMGLLSEKEALDLQILQKILPRIQGSLESVDKTLTALKDVCTKYGFSRSAEKIAFMQNRLQTDGFTSYWG